MRGVDVCKRKWPGICEREGHTTFSLGFSQRDPDKGHVAERVLLKLEAEGRICFHDKAADLRRARSLYSLPVIYIRDDSHPEVVIALNDAGVIRRLTAKQYDGQRRIAEFKQQRRQRQDQRDRVMAEV